MTENSQQSAPFPIEEVARYPAPGMAIPGAFSFSPDDRLLTYLFSAEGSLSRQLYVFDLRRTAAAAACPFRWRRQRRESFVGRTVAPRAPAPARDWGDSVRLGGARPTGARGAACRSFHVGWHGGRAAAGGGRGDASILDPQFSPDGLWIAYVQHDELCVVSVEGGEPCQLTAGAKSTGKTHGLAEYIAQEEMDRRHGYWWSPDSAWIAFAEVDETHIPIYRIVHQGKDAVGEGARRITAIPLPARPTPKCGWAWSHVRVASRSGWMSAVRTRAAHG